MKASRCMWIRRFIRVGDLVAPVFKVILIPIKFCFGSIGSALITTVLVGAACGVTSCTRYVMHDDEIATGSEIQEFMAKSDCLRRTIPTLSYPDGSPLKYKDLKQWDQKCFSLVTNADRVAEQQKAMAGK